MGSEPALDVLSLHVNIGDLVGHALAIVDEYDCEAVGMPSWPGSLVDQLLTSLSGDPQTAVSHLGDVVLFLQITSVRYNVRMHRARYSEAIFSHEYSSLYSFRLAI